MGKRTTEDYKRRSGRLRDLFAAIVMKANSLRNRNSLLTADILEVMCRFGSNTTFEAVRKAFQGNPPPRNLTVEDSLLIARILFQYGDVDEFDRDEVFTAEFLELVEAEDDPFPYARSCFLLDRINLKKKTVTSQLNPAAAPGPSGNSVLHEHFTIRGRDAEDAKMLVVMGAFHLDGDLNAVNAVMNSEALTKKNIDEILRKAKNLVKIESIDEPTAFFEECKRFIKAGKPIIIEDSD